MSVQRPLSPHLQNYRKQITSVLSILHRISGLFLSLGSVLLMGWIVAVAAGPEQYAYFQDFTHSWFGYLLLLGLAFSLIFHVCNGIRHLFWDIGWGFDLDAATTSGWVVVVVSVIGTLIAAMGIFGGAL